MHLAAHFMESLINNEYFLDICRMAWQHSFILHCYRSKYMYTNKMYNAQFVHAYEQTVVVILVFSMIARETAKSAFSVQIAPHTPTHTHTHTPAHQHQRRAQSKKCAHKNAICTNGVRTASARDISTHIEERRKFLLFNVCCSHCV